MEEWGVGRQRILGLTKEWSKRERERGEGKERERERKGEGEEIIEVGGVPRGILPCLLFSLSFFSPCVRFSSFPIPFSLLFSLLLPLLDSLSLPSFIPLSLLYPPSSFFFYVPPGFF